MKATMLTIILGAITMGLVAQAQEAAEAPKEHSMTGCLRLGDQENTFRLTDLEKGPPTVEIVESPANLAPHVGHKVEVTGSSVPGPEGVHSMKITGIKHIAAECP